MAALSALAGEQPVQVQVDDALHPFLARFNWWIGNHGYATANVNGKRVLLHRLVTFATATEQVDHINRDRLDCRLSNLRLCSLAENNRNRAAHRDGTNPFKGVYHTKREKPWLARICWNRRQVSLGRFADVRHAALAYDRAALVLHGQFCVVNLPAEAAPPEVAAQVDRVLARINEMKERVR